MAHREVNDRRPNMFKLIEHHEYSRFYNSKINEVEFNTHPDGSLAIEISITEYKGKLDRRYEMAGSIVLTQDQVNELINHLQSKVE